jgi:outer membrane lipoprotein SlyB
MNERVQQNRRGDTHAQLAIGPFALDPVINDEKWYTCASVFSGSATKMLRTIRLNVISSVRPVQMMCVRLGSVSHKLLF